MITITKKKTAVMTVLAVAIAVMFAGPLALGAQSPPSISIRSWLRSWWLRSWWLRSAAGAAAGAAAWAAAGAAVWRRWGCGGLAAAVRLRLLSQ